MLENDQPPGGGGACRVVHAITACIVEVCVLRASHSLHIVSWIIVCVLGTWLDLLLHVLTWRCK